MRLSRADPANCVRAVLNFVLRRWLWLMPNPTTARFLRETEQAVINACWLQPGPGHSVNTLSCNVGLFQPKTFQVPVTDLYIFIKIYSEIGPVMHVLRPGCIPNLQPPVADDSNDSSSPCVAEGRAVYQGHGRHIAGGWGSLWVKTVCTFDMTVHFPSHQFMLWILCVWLNKHSNNNNTYSRFCLQGNIPIFLSFLCFPLEKNSHILIILWLGQTFAFILCKKVNI